MDKKLKKNKNKYFLVNDTSQNSKKIIKIIYPLRQKSRAQLLRPVAKQLLFQIFYAKIDSAKDFHGFQAQIWQKNVICTVITNGVAHK